MQGRSDQRRFSRVLGGGESAAGASTRRRWRTKGCVKILRRISAAVGERGCGLARAAESSGRTGPNGASHFCGARHGGTAREISKSRRGEAMSEGAGTKMEKINGKLSWEQREHLLNHHLGLTL